MKKLLALVMMLVLLLPAAVAETLEAQLPAEVLEKNGYAFDGLFNAFFAENPDDQELLELTTGTLLAVTPEGDVVTDGITGLSVNYKGEETTYYGLGSVDIVENADGTVDYNVSIREDTVFADGHPVSIDDVIFTIYVLCDPSYDGPSVFRLQPVAGMQEYCGTARVLSDLMLEAGRDNTEFEFWDEATQQAFWADVDAAGAALAQEIVDYIAEEYMEDGYTEEIGKTASEVAGDPQLQLQLCMYMWGYGEDYREGMSVTDYWKLMLEEYGGDVLLAAETESVESEIFDLIDGYQEKYGKIVYVGEPVEKIEGVIRTGDYSMTIRMTEHSDNALDVLAALPVMPMHYYGNEEFYAWENNVFGFEKGDMSLMHAKDDAPLGCGRYTFEGYAEGTATLEANVQYFEDVLAEPHKILLHEE